MTENRPYCADDLVTIYHADCADILPTIDPADVALVLTDPPYGIDLDTDYAGRMHRSGSSRWDERVANDADPFDPRHLIATFDRLVLFGANYYVDTLPLGSWIVWHKRDVAPVLSDCEMAWHNCGGKRVSYFGPFISRDRPRIHPTQKPVDLMRWIVGAFTDPGDLVLDPYMGSGPVARACADLGRRYIGIELVEDYCAAAVGRLGQQALDLTGEVSA